MHSNAGHPLAQHRHVEDAGMTKRHTFGTTRSLRQVIGMVSLVQKVLFQRLVFLSDLPIACRIMFHAEVLIEARRPRTSVGEGQLRRHPLVIPSVGFRTLGAQAFRMRTRGVGGSRLDPRFTGAVRRGFIKIWRRTIMIGCFETFRASTGFRSSTFQRRPFAEASSCRSAEADDPCKHLRNHSRSSLGVRQCRRYVAIKPRFE